METGVTEREGLERERVCVCCRAVWRRTGWRKESYNVGVPHWHYFSHFCTVLLSCHDNTYLVSQVYFTEDVLNIFKTLKAVFMFGPPPPLIRQNPCRRFLCSSQLELFVHCVFCVG